MSIFKADEPKMDWGYPEIQCHFNDLISLFVPGHIYTSLLHTTQRISQTFKYSDQSDAQLLFVNVIMTK